MKSNKLYYVFSFMKPCLLLLTLVWFMSNGDAFSQEKKKKKVEHLEIRVGLEIAYDDNILKYSDKYLERFMNGEDPGRFHIETYDDLILNPSLEGIYTFHVFKKVKSRINANFSPRIYSVNGIKNWSYASIGFQQYLTKRASFKIYYSYISEFYVRHFRDDAWVDVYGYTPETFQPYSFAKDNFGFWIQNTFFKNTRIRFLLNYARYYHNEHYTEYDSKDWLYGMTLYQPLHKKLRLDIGYEFVNSNAKGYDAAYQTPETTNGPDATFQEDRFTMALRWKLPKLKKRNNDLEVEFAFLKRYYSSPYPALVDPLHAGRIDNNYRVYFTYQLSLHKSLDVEAYYNWLMRDSDTKARINSIYVSNEKDYRQDIFGLKFTYSFKI